MQKVTWTDEAMHSLADIYDYIYEESPQNADKVFETLFSLGNSLADKRFDFGKDTIINQEEIRFIPKWSYKIIYERFKNEVIILDVFNTRKHPDRLQKFKKK